LCAGLGGPARYLAHCYGAFATGVELTPARVAGASELIRRVGLNRQVQMIEANVTALPLPDQSQDAVVSQEALFHVPDLARAFGEAHRVLRPGGRFAFADWIAHKPLSAADEQLLRDSTAAATLINIDQHAELLRGAGFEIESIEDETDRWALFSPSACICTRSCAARPSSPPHRLATTTLQILRAVRQSDATEGHGWRQIAAVKPA
jgi:sarcosine/dimethylglycine N-methyltransferase